MPPSAGYASKAGGVQKRMRKGTKSCLPCRRRKIRCSGTSDGGACTECNSRGDSDRCVAQGVVSDDIEAINRRLQHRVEQLEARLAVFNASGIGAESSSGQASLAGERTPQQALHHLLQRTEYEPSEVNSDDDEGEELDNTTAPLMHLLTNSVLIGSDGSVRANSRSFEATATTTKSGNSSMSAKHNAVIRDLCSHLPSENEMNDIFDNHSSWWPLYRDTLHLVWGQEGDNSLRGLALQAFSDGQPSLLGLLLVCFAISTGDLPRFLPPVEKHILKDDQFAGTEHGFNCMMAAGLCYISSLQPRRAWSIYRRANTLLQLNGLHQRHRSEKQDHLFWQLFHADRWVSLLIGLPYMVPNQLCELTIPPMGDISPGVWLYKKFGLITSRVIDCLQNVQGPKLATSMEIDEELEELISKMPTTYLEMTDIRACRDLMEKCTRLYRLIHFHLLKSLVHLPFLLLAERHDRYRFSHAICLESSRSLLEAYLEIFDTDPLMAVHGTILNFNAFTSAAILLLGLIKQDQAAKLGKTLELPQIEADWHIIRRVASALKHGATFPITRLLCGKCHSALESLITNVQNTDSGASNRVVLPYFGTISITHTHQSSQKEKAQLQQMPVGTTQLNGRSSEAGQHISSQQTLHPFPGAQAFPSPAFDMSFTYSGPYLPDADTTTWMMNEDFWSNQMYDDWSWLATDLPPNSGI